MLGGSQPWVAAIAVGVAILVMLATDSFILRLKSTR